MLTAKAFDIIPHIKYLLYEIKSHTSVLPFPRFSLCLFINCAVLWNGSKQCWNEFPYLFHENYLVEIYGIQNMFGKHDCIRLINTMI